MSEPDQGETVQPIIIVKRGGGDHDEHHGGVWKIAFADFMTAMMAFFLVMWLINAANEETRAQVASYFNPVKLTDAVAGPKGVRSNKPFTETEEHDSTEGAGAKPKGNGDADSAQVDEKKNEKANEEEEVSTPEEHLFKDPYAVLVEIAGEATRNQVSGSKAANRGDEGQTWGGEAFRDPFDPAFWHKSVDEILDELPAGSQAGADKKRASETPVHGAKRKKLEQAATEAESAKSVDTATQQNRPQETKKASKQRARKDDGQTAAVVQRPPDSSAKKPSTKSPAEPVKATKTHPSGKPQQASEKPEADAAEARKLREEIAKSTKDMASGNQPVLNVEKTDDGFLVSLTDNVDFGMFASASARPNADTVRYMDKVASILANRPGKLIVRGHTDSRPFRSNDYDNWRLSTARAHMAYHMLVRGGVKAERVMRIEGHADRNPINQQDTTAAQNRRIEILLVKDAS